MTISLHRILLVVLLQSPLLMFSQETVYLESSEKGRGILKSRNGTCFVVCPGHVVEDSYGDITIVGDNYRVSTGELLKVYSQDIAIVRLKKGEEQNCKNWSPPEKLDLILDQHSEGVLEIRSDIGSVSNLPVDIIEYDGSTILVKLKDSSQSIAKGMSGSSFFVNFGGAKSYMGMLLEVEDGKGIVLQSDNIERIVFDFFNVNFDRTPLDTSSAIQNDQLKTNFRNSIQKDIDFLDSYFTDGLNSNSKYLKLRIEDFLETAGSKFESYPVNLKLESRKEAAYRNQIIDIQNSFKELQTLFNNSKGEWDRDSIPMISMLLLQLTELKSTLN